MTESFQADLIDDSRCRLGESPFWDPASNAIAWVDIDRAQLHRLAPGTGKRTTDPLPGETSFVAVSEGGGLVCASPLGVFRRVDGRDVAVAPAWFDPDLARPNDGAVDLDGRVWVGATRRDREPGSGGMGVVIDGAWQSRIVELTLPNGIAWSPNGRRMYYVDTFQGTLWSARYDSETAGVRDSSPLFVLERDRGLIDGICVDVEGTVWAAVWGGNEVLRIDPSGNLIGRIRVGAEKVTSCAFGPAGSTVLYITSADPEGTDTPGEGGLFAADVGVEGVPVAAASLGNRS